MDRQRSADLANHARMLKGTVDSSDMNALTKRQVIESLEELAGKVESYTAEDGDGELAGQERKAARSTVETGGGKPASDGKTGAQTTGSTVTK